MDEWTRAPRPLLHVDTRWRWGIQSSRKKETGSPMVNDRSTLGFVPEHAFDLWLTGSGQGDECSRQVGALQQTAQIAAVVGPLACLLQQRPARRSESATCAMPAVSLRHRLPISSSSKSWDGDFKDPALRCSPTGAPEGDWPLRDGPMISRKGNCWDNAPMENFFKR